MRQTDSGALTASKLFYLVMTSIPVTTEIKIEADKLCAAMDIADVVSLISYAANYYAEQRPGDVNDRRIMISQIENKLSENGRRLIGELAGCVYGRQRQNVSDQTREE